MRACVCDTYIHTYIHAYIHTYIHTYIHAYASLCVCVRVCACVCLCAHEQACLEAWMRIESVMSDCCVSLISMDMSVETPATMKLLKRQRSNSHCTMCLSQEQAAIVVVLQTECPRRNEQNTQCPFVFGLPK